MNMRGACLPHHDLADTGGKGCHATGIVTLGHHGTTAF